MLSKYIIIIKGCTLNFFDFVSLFRRNKEFFAIEKLVKYCFLKIVNYLGICILYLIFVLKNNRGGDSNVHSVWNVPTS